MRERKNAVTTFVAVVRKMIVLPTFGRNGRLGQTYVKSIENEIVFRNILLTESIVNRCHVGSNLFSHTI